MSKGFGALGLAGVIGTGVAWFGTPSLAGWAGFGKALLIGAGTSMGGSIAAAPVLIVVTLAVGLVTRKKTAALAMGAIAGLAGGVYGAVEGYNFSKDAVVNQGCKTSFNDQAAPTRLSAINGKTFVITAPKLG